MNTELRSIAEVARDWALKKGQISFGSSLCGMCAIASAHLFNELKHAGYKPVIHATDEHCWVEVSGTVVDITAMQFGYKDIVIANRIDDGTVDIDGCQAWLMDKEFTSVKEFQNWQIDNNWPNGQIVPRSLIKD